CRCPALPSLLSYPTLFRSAARMINRPLVVAPQLLTPEEEAYFLPHVFNVSEEEARMDYIDIQGGRWLAQADSARVYADKLNTIRSEEHTSELQSRENLVCR